MVWPYDSLDCLLFLIRVGSLLIQDLIPLTNGNKTTVALALMLGGDVSSGFFQSVLDYFAYFSNTPLNAVFFVTLQHLHNVIILTCNFSVYKPGGVFFHYFCLSWFNVRASITCISRLCHSFGLCFTRSLAMIRRIHSEILCA